MTIRDITAGLIRSLTIGLLFTISPALTWAQSDCLIFNRLGP